MGLSGSNVSPFALTLKTQLYDIQTYTYAFGLRFHYHDRVCTNIRGTKDVENMKSYRKT